MVRRLIYFLILYTNAVFSQGIIHGKIIDGSTKLPLEKANVFVSNTTFTAITNSDGTFTIRIPENNYQMAVSYVGYGSSVIKSSQLATDKLNIIELFAEIGSIKPITVISSEKRKNYLRMFRNAILGTSENAKLAKILNIEDVFLEITEDGSLHASIDAPLEIENSALNYNLSFLLTDFMVDTKTEISMYSGYLSFREMKVGKSINPKRIDKNRKRAYYGSAMHFFRSAYQEKLKDDGFVVSSFSRKIHPGYPNDDKLKEMYEYARLSKDYTHIHNLPQKYIIKKIASNLSATDFTNYYDGKKILNFTNYLEIVYSKEYPEREYFEYMHRPAEGFQTSQIQLNKYDVEIFPDGNYFEPDGITFFGYMGWKKLADALPLDYEPVELN